MKSIAVAGSLVLDITPIIAFGSHLSLDGGSQAYLDQIETSIGGCVGNTGIALHRLGFPVTLIGKVGDDTFGYMVRDVISRSGCHASIIMAEGESTSSSIILLPEDGNRIILHKKGASNMLAANEIIMAIPEGVSMLHLGYMLNLGQLWMDAENGLIPLLKEMRSSGITVSADTSSIKRGDIDLAYHRSTLEAVLGHCDIFMPSVSDVCPLYPEYFACDDIPGAARHFIECGAAIVLIKDGSNGMYLQTACSDRISRIGSIFRSPDQIERWTDKSLWRKAPDVKDIISTTGAGDVAVAGFLAALLLDSPLSAEEAVSLSTALAGISLGSRDATSLIPDISGVLPAVMNYQSSSRI